MGLSFRTVPSLKAHSVGRPLIKSLADNPFSGYVAGIYRNSCNIIGYDGRMITIVNPPISKGPFSVIIESHNLFSSINTKMYVRANSHRIEVGNILFIHFEHVDCWEPKMIQLPSLFRLKSTSAELLINYTQWPKKQFKNTSSNYARDKLICGARNLQHALVNGYSIKKAVKSLAGLGFGLTPSGDDYLLGVMASLWLTKNTNFLEEIGCLSSQKTTSLSAAYLMAASKGDFAECWHDLAQAVLYQDLKALRDSISEFLQIGASSGRDALAGFSTHILESRFSLNVAQN